MEEIKIFSHLICSDTHHEYILSWGRRIIDTKPKIEKGMPIFIVRGGNGRMELNTTDMKRVEHCAKLVSKPKGRGAISSDEVQILIKQVDDSEILVGTLTHNYVKDYRPMYDKVYWRD